MMSVLDVPRFNFGALSARYRFNDGFDVRSALLSTDEFDDLWLISSADLSKSTFDALPLAPPRLRPYSML